MHYRIKKSLEDENYRKPVQQAAENVFSNERRHTSQEDLKYKGAAVWI